MMIIIIPTSFAEKQDMLLILINWQRVKRRMPYNGINPYAITYKTGCRRTRFRLGSAGFGYGAGPDVCCTAIPHPAGYGTRTGLRVSGRCLAAASKSPRSRALHAGCFDTGTRKHVRPPFPGTDSRARLTPARMRNFQVPASCGTGDASLPRNPQTPGTVDGIRYGHPARPGPGHMPPDACCRMRSIPCLHAPPGFRTIEIYSNRQDPNPLKAIITCAGTGTRLMPYTKELPKEMAPIFARGPDLTVKPTLQQIYEDLHLRGIRDFCFVTSRTKRAIEDHFTPVVSAPANPALKAFHDMLVGSSIVWVNQIEPRGFGHAVLASRPYAYAAGGGGGDEGIIVHAGDSFVIPKNGPDRHPLNRLMESSKDPGVEAAFLIRRVSDPRRHGIAEVEREDDHYAVTGVEEKPSRPRSPWGIVPAYLFRGSIFDALAVTPPSVNDEIQLTDAIQRLIDRRKKVIAFEVGDGENILVDVGTPQSYWRSMSESYSQGDR